jgi:hypoxanthine phosphoribosyltransferase
MNKDPHAILAQSERVYSSDQVNHAIDLIASEVTLQLEDACPLVLTIMNGGLFFAGHLLPKLKFPLEQDFLHASRYQGGIEGKVIEWRTYPTNKIKDRVVLLLDDILDEGITLEKVKAYCLEQGAKAVKIAVLTEKNPDRPKPTSADFSRLIVPDQYVFGCGMDAYGWWRNLPEIYALRD